jgi:hypothetical protein
LLTGSQTTDRSRELIVSMSLLLCNGNDDDDDDDMISVKGRLSRMFLLLTGKRWLMDLKSIPFSLQLISLWGRQDINIRRQQEEDRTRRRSYKNIVQCSNVYTPVCTPVIDVSLVTSLIQTHASV